MVAVVKRMKKLKTLLNIRLGLGAAVIPSSSPVTRLHLTYAQKAEQGHLGARKFWRICLPRLKFHNPAVGVSVKQTQDQAGPALLSVYFAQAAAEANPAAIEKEQSSSDASESNSSNSSSSSSRSNSDTGLDSLAPAPTTSETVSVLNVKEKDESAILKEFCQLTGAQLVKATEEERAEIKNAMEAAERIEISKQQAVERRQKMKDQEAMLRAAKEDVKKLRAE